MPVLSGEVNAIPQMLRGAPDARLTRWLSPRISRELTVHAGEPAMLSNRPSQRLPGAAWASGVEAALALESADVALLIPSLRGGGAEGVTSSLAQALGRRGVRVHLVVLQSEGAWRSRLSETTALVDLRAPRALAALLPLVRYLRRSRPSVLVSGPSHLSVLSILAIRLAAAGTRMIALEHNDLSGRKAMGLRASERILVWAMRLTYRGADRVLAVSQGAAESLVLELGLPRHRVGVLYDGIDVKQVSALAEHPVDHPWLQGGDVPVVLSVGRLVPQKGSMDLIEAFALLVKETDARLIIMGEGPLGPDIRALVHSRQLDDRVHLVGFQPNPYAYMARASAFILASRFEGFGIVLAEALACGAPIVSTDCRSGPAEILENGRCGLLVPVGDPQGMAHAALRVLRDRALASQLRRDGPRRAAAFDIERMADRLVEVIQEMA
jgi:glycosyltransferase involved in cell wall biosynthesis